MTPGKSQWVWHRKWTFVRFTFTVSRYLPFFGIGMTVVGELQMSKHWLITKFAHDWWIAALRTQYYPGESVSYAIPYTRNVRDNCVVCWVWTGVYWSACISGYRLIYSFILCSALHTVSVVAAEGI
jgi:hypothetical protein